MSAGVVPKGSFVATGRDIELLGVSVELAIRTLHLRGEPSATFRRVR